MKPQSTDALIDSLAAQPHPTPSLRRIFARRLSAGLGMAILLTAAVLGFRHDALTAAGMAAYGGKLAYTLALALTGFAVMERLARPGARTGFRAWLLLLPFVAISMAALNQWQNADAVLRPHLFWGGSWLVCPYLIVAVSAPVFAASILALRHLAPTRPMEAGAMAGFFAGAAGATVYGFHCGESAMVFVAVWYSAGIAAMTLIGAVTGRWLLRW